MTTADPAHSPDLLRFARDVYAQPDIQALCLRVQDDLDVDVVLLLMCCWYGCYHGTLSEAQFARAADFSGQWRAQLVQPLRHARRWLKPHPADAAGISTADQESLRQRIKALELDAEFMQLRALEALFAEPIAAPINGESESTAHILANLTRYPGTDRAAGLDEDALSLLTRACLQCR